MNHYKSRDGVDISVNYCQCCGKEQPDGTLILKNGGFRAYCEECLYYHTAPCPIRRR
jgi:hypothetical protein